MRVLVSAILIAFGVMAVISGEADNSPGLQGLGLILVLSIIFIEYRNRKSK